MQQIWLLKVESNLQNLSITYSRKILQLTSAAINCPSPSGKVRLDITTVITAGYMKRLEENS